MTILDLINTESLVNAIYSRLNQYDCIALSKYICESKNITPEQVCFMSENDIYLSNEDIIQGARELFGECFYINIINSCANMN